jgi:outer membrane protein assembly factor BamB
MMAHRFDPDSIEERDMHRALTLLFLAAVLTATLHADQWPTWRGPSSSGVSVERNLPVEWSDTKAVAWKSPVRGLGISSPIVWNEMVIVTSQAGSGEVRQGPSPDNSRMST